MIKVQVLSSILSLEVDSPRYVFVKSSLHLNLIEYMYKVESR